MNCDKFKDSDKTNEDGESLYETCLAIRAICEEAKVNDEELPEECVPPEKRECDSDDSECEEKESRGRGLRRILLEDTEYSAEEAPKCKPVDFDDKDDKNKKRDYDEEYESYSEDDSDDDSDEDRSRGDKDDRDDEREAPSCDGDSDCEELREKCS